MRCIEIKGAQASLEAFAPININMRCIEICYRACKYAFDRININMRCIEIIVKMVLYMWKDMININMRCIEICFT